MKKLLKKEMKLTAVPLTYFFILFSLMALIPGYPIAVGGFFVCLGIFYTFQFSREYNDTFYTALLPIRKKDVVKAKFVFSIGIQMVSFLLFAALTAVRMAALAQAAPYASNPMMNANLAFLGYILIIFGVFNLLFLEGFFRTAYYVGKPFIKFIIVSFLVIGAAETLHHLPGLSALNHGNLRDPLPQTAVFFLGVVLYVLMTWCSYRKSVREFEKIDL